MFIVWTWLNISRLPSRNHHDERKIYVNFFKHVFMGNHKAARVKNEIAPKALYCGQQVSDRRRRPTMAKKVATIFFHFSVSLPRSSLNITCDLTLDTLFKIFILRRSRFFFSGWARAKALFKACIAWQKSIMLINKSTISHTPSSSGRQGTFTGRKKKSEKHLYQRS